MERILRVGEISKVGGWTSKGGHKSYVMYACIPDVYVLCMVHYLG